MYAVNGGKREVAQQCVAPALVPVLTSSQPLGQIRRIKIGTVKPNQETTVSYYKGQKIRVNLGLWQEGVLAMPEVFTFLVDQVLDIVLGIVGAVVGGWVFSMFEAHGVTGVNLYSLIVAAIGAVLVLVVYHAVRGGRARA